jgi:hypothetical protein
MDATPYDASRARESILELVFVQLVASIETIDQEAVPDHQTTR